MITIPGCDGHSCCCLLSLRVLLLKLSLSLLADTDSILAIIILAVGFP